MEQWKGFKGGAWQEEVNVEDFIIKNYKEYTGDDSFLEGPTEATKNFGNKCLNYPNKSAKKAAFLTWTLKLFLPSLPTVQVI